MARAVDAKIAKGEGGPLERHSARHQGPVRDQGRAHHGVLETSSAISCRPTNRPSPRISGATAR